MGSYLPFLHVNENLKHLDICNNINLKHIVREIISFAPNLEYLDIIGLPMFLVNLTRHTKIKILKFSHLDDCTLLLNTVRLDEHLDLTIRENPIT